MFVDTGNSLIDPLTGYPVMVVEAESLKPYCLMKCIKQLYPIVLIFIQKPAIGIAGFKIPPHSI